MDPRITGGLPPTPHGPPAKQDAAGLARTSSDSRPGTATTGMSPLEAFRASPQFAALRAARQRRLAAVAPAAASSAGGAPAQVPRRPVLPTVPERLREKILAVDLEKLKVLDPEFHDYAKRVVAQTSSGRRPDAQTLQADIRHLPLVAAMENHRNPGLDLHACRTPAECFRLILDKERAGVPGNFRVVYSADKFGTDHHAALDVRTEPGKPTSIIGYESALDGGTSFFKKDLEANVPNVRVTFVHNLIQSSEHDCVMFALNNALKAFKARDDFAAQAHRQNQDAGADVIPRKEVPAVFKKHSQSRDVVNESQLHAQTIVTKAKAGAAAETLTQRIHAYRARRSSHDYSTSIEGFRLQEIKRVQDYLADRAERRSLQGQPPSDPACPG